MQYLDSIASCDTLQSRGIVVDAYQYSQLVDQIPEEIWRTILLFTTRDTCDSTTLRKMVCVKKSWAKMIREFVRLYFRCYRPSNWLLSQYPEVKNLDLIFVRQTLTERVTNDFLRTLTNLKSLNLRKNYYISDDGLKDLINLETLKLNDLISDESLRTLTNLKHLDISGNELISDECLNYMTSLLSLELEESQQITGRGIENLTNLTKLKCNPRGSEDLSIGLSKLTNLTELIADCAGFEEIEAIKKLVKLRKLSIHTYDELPYSLFSNLTDLSTLKIIEDCVIDNDVLSRLSNLTSLSIESEYIDTNCIFHLTNLSTFHFNNSPHIYNECLKSLPFLTNFVMNDNISDQGIKHLTALTSLKVNEKISFEGIKEMTNLVRLDATSSKGMNKIPVNVERFSELKSYYGQRILSKPAQHERVSLFD